MLCGNLIKFCIFITVIGGVLLLNKIIIKSVKHNKINNFNLNFNLNFTFTSKPILINNITFNLTNESLSKLNLINNFTREFIQNATLINNLTRDFTQNVPLINNFTKEPTSKLNLINNLTREFIQNATLINNLTRELTQNVPLINNFTKEPTSKPTSKPIIQPTNKPTSKPTNQPNITQKQNKRYAIFIAGQSNAASTNLGPILDKSGQLDEPNSRIKAIYTGSPVNAPTWDLSNLSNLSNLEKNIKNNNLIINNAYIARNPLSCLGPPQSLFNNNYGCGGILSVSFGFHFAKLLLPYLNEQDELYILNGAYSGTTLMPTYLGSWDPDIIYNNNTSINFYHNAIKFYNNAIIKYDLTPLVLLYIGGEFEIGIDAKDYVINFNKNYQEQLYLRNTSLFQSFRRDIKNNNNLNLNNLNFTKIPIIISTLLDNLYKWPNIGGQFIYETHLNISKHLDQSRVISQVLNNTYAEKDKYLMLQMKNNSYQALHFSAAGHRLLGKLFLDAFLNLSIKLK